MSQFKFVTIPIGSSGWVSGHVAINMDEVYRWPESDPNDNYCLNTDTASFADFSKQIDRLISELEKVRKTGQRHFDRVQATT